MTDMVTCRVCGCASPLGTAECPDCGAPLPQNLPKAAAEPSSEPPETAVPAKEEKRPSPKRRWARRVAAFAAVCLAVELAAAMWPQKEPPPGMDSFGDGGLITPNGVWNCLEEGLYVDAVSNNGAYALLQKGDMTSSRHVKYGGLSSLSYAPTGDYYLFDGRTLEEVDWETAVLAGDNAAFYTTSDETSTTLFHRDLATGKTHKLERFEGEGTLDLRASSDGTAAAYRWGEEETYSLWRCKDRKSVPLDSGEVWGVGKGGETCLLWGQDQSWQLTRYGSLNGALRGYYENSYFLWRNGEVIPLPNMLMMWNNSRFTQFFFRDYQDDLAGDWYYFDLDTMTQPLRLELSGESYLSAVGLSYWNNTMDDLTGRFYLAYEAGSDKVYYFTHRGELLLVEEELAGDFLTDAAGQSAVYLKDGSLCRVSVQPDGTMETQLLTGAATVTAFAVNEDLTHIYYLARNDPDLYASQALCHWYGGESHVLDFELNSNYGSIPMTVTNDGGCYITYARNIYYTQKDEPPTLLLEEAGMSAFVRLIKPGKWVLASGARWEDGKNQSCFWRLNGYDGPVELTEWYPKEGKL